METTQVHINKIRAGDAVIHNGKVQTVCGTDIKHDKFMGKTIFGDCYKLGYMSVTKVIKFD
jgi:hypothetical protein